MKTLILITVLSFTLLNLSAANYTTAGTGGQWNLNATWGVASFPDDATDNATLNNNDSVWLPAGVTIRVSLITFNNNSKLFIPETSELIVDSIAVLNNADFYVDGTLTLYGGINMRNNSTLDISLTGVLDIGGDFVGSNGVSITNDGDLNIAGDLYLGTGATMTGAGTVSAGTYSGTGTVFGTSIGTLLDGETYYDNGGATPLPVEIISFSVVSRKSAISVKWQTASEENNDYFTIERSADGITFEIIATVKGAGNSKEELSYSYNDNNPLTGTSYYRLKQTDYNGDFEYFSVVSASFIREDFINISPMPATTELTVNLLGEIGQVDLQLVNINGAIVKSLKGLENYTTLDISELPKGMYFLTISSENSRIVKQIILQ